MKYVSKTTIGNHVGDTFRHVVAKGIPFGKKTGAVGIAMIAGGIYILIRSAFMSGAEAFEYAEIDLMDELGLYNYSGSEVTAKGGLMK